MTARRGLDTARIAASSSRGRVDPKSTGKLCAAAASAAIGASSGIGSLSDATNATMLVVLGILLVLALWAFPSTARRGRAYGADDD